MKNDNPFGHSICHLADCNKEFVRSSQGNRFCCSDHRVQYHSDKRRQPIINQGTEKMKAEILELINNLDSIHSSYQSLEILLVDSTSDAVNVARVLCPLNKALESDLDKITALLRQDKVII